MCVALSHTVCVADRRGQRGRGTRDYTVLRPHWIHHRGRDASSFSYTVISEEIAAPKQCDHQLCSCLRASFVEVPDQFYSSCDFAAFVAG